MFSLLIISSLYLLRGIEGNENASAPFWDYGSASGPEKWKELYPSCNDTKQSPINLIRSKIVRARRYQRLDFFGYKTKVYNAYLENNGHTVQLLIEDPIQKFRGRGLNDTYKFLKMIFHWGQTEDEGSEHAFSGGYSPLEMQLIHYNTRYEPKEALTKPDGLAAFAILFEISHVDNRKLNPVLNNLDEIIEANSVTKIDDFFYLDDFLPTESKDYFKYPGSLTSPPCHQSVSWIVFKSTLSISEHQLQKFRRLKNSSGYSLVNNFRPVEPIEERIIIFHKEIPNRDYDPFVIRDDDDDDDDDIDIDIDIKFKNKDKHKYKYKDKYKDKSKDKYKDKSKNKYKDKHKHKKRGGTSAVTVPTIFVILISTLVTVYTLT